jgi:hypothetical protein
LVQKTQEKRKPEGAIHGEKNPKTPLRFLESLQCIIYYTFIYFPG